MSNAATGSMEIRADEFRRAYGQVKAEIDSLPAGADGAIVTALEKRIHSMLFADTIEGGTE